LPAGINQLLTRSQNKMPSPYDNEIKAQIKIVLFVMLACIVLVAGIAVIK